MIKNSTKRVILRWIHLLFTIPVLGYVYGIPSEVQQYAGGTRFIFVPMIMLTGYWMYAGFFFALLAVAVWLALVQLHGSGAAILSQMVLLIGYRIWRVIRGRSRTAIA
jgi:hypothetical protein